MKRPTNGKNLLRYIAPLLFAIPLVVAVVLLSGRFVKPVTDMVSLAVKMGVIP